MDNFKVICCQCGSDKVLEKSARNEIDVINKKIKYAEGIQRKCLDCNNESFVIYKTMQ